MTIQPCTLPPKFTSVGSVRKRNVSSRCWPGMGLSGIWAADYAAPGSFADVGPTSECDRHRVIAADTPVGSMQHSARAQGHRHAFGILVAGRNRDRGDG